MYTLHCNGSQDLRGLGFYRKYYLKYYFISGQSGVTFKPTEEENTYVKNVIWSQQNNYDALPVINDNDE